MLLRRLLFADQYRRIHSELVDYTSKGLVSVIREGDKIIIRLADKVSIWAAVKRSLGLQCCQH